MTFIFDIQDEQNILKQMSRNRNKAELMGQACAEQGRVRQANKWVKSGQEVSIKIMLLEHIFQNKN
ncbi:MAG: hypothetical protein EOO61_03985 [Hymenobacter sp.]|nr:MAG: hypothetical protein EOO61_03985 [Hymenobacter sp.]